MLQRQEINCPLIILLKATLAQWPGTVEETGLSIKRACFSWGNSTSPSSSGWKPTHPTSVFSLRTSVFTSPYGTTLIDFADLQMLNTDVCGC
jgi:hypothetical protein